MNEPSTDTIDPATEATLLVEALVAAMVNSRIYAIDHPRVLGSIDEVHESVRNLTTLLDISQLRLGVFDGMVVFRRRPLLGASLSVCRLVERMQSLGCGGIEIKGGADVDELRVFFAVLVDRSQLTADFEVLNGVLRQRGCRRVTLLPPYVDGLDETPDSTTRVGIDAHQAVVDMLQNVTVSVCRGGRIDFAPVQAQAEQLLRRLEARQERHLGLARRDQYDAFTFGHSLRVAVLALHFARHLTEDRELLLRIGTAALLHDVGKSLIPFEILHSTKVLSDDERREMNRHAELGAECLLDHHDSDPLAIAAAFGHHQTADGSGYPKTSHRHPVTMVTHIVKICDIYEALTAARPYKQPMSPVRAYRVMIGMGDKLDQRLLRRFIEINGIYPVGQFVELDDGTVAVVRDQSGDMLRPRVAQLGEGHGHELFGSDEPLLDLSDVECGCARSILRELTPDQATLKVRGER